MAYLVAMVTLKQNINHVTAFFVCTVMVCREHTVQLVKPITTNSYKCNIFKYCAYKCMVYLMFS